MTKGMLMGVVGMLMAAVGGGLAACSAGTAVAAGAGAAGALYWTGRQSQATAQGTMEQLADRSRQVMTEMSITPTNTEGSPTGDQYELHGKLNDMDITIELKPKGGDMTQVEVTAKKSEVNYERGTSEQILSAILAKGGTTTGAATTGANLNSSSTTTTTSGYQPMRSDSSTVTRTDTSDAMRADSMHVTATDSVHMQSTTSDTTHVTRTDSTTAAPR